MSLTFNRLLLLFLISLSSLIGEVDQLLISPPDGWKTALKETLPKRIKLMLVGQGKGFFPPSIHLGIEPYPGTHQEYLRMVKHVNTTFGDKTRELGEIDTPAGKGLLIQVDSKNNFGPLRLLHFVLIRERTVFVLTGVSLQAESGSLMSTFLKVVQGLRFAPSLYDEIPSEEALVLREKTEELYQHGRSGLPAFEAFVKKQFGNQPETWKARLLAHVDEVLNYSYK